MFTVLFMCVFENVAPEHGWTLRSAAAKVGAIVNGLIQQSIEEAAPRTAPVSITFRATSVHLAFFAELSHSTEHLC